MDIRQKITTALPFILLIIAMHSSCVSAADVVGATLKAGASGIGTDVTVGFSDNLTLRFGVKNGRV